MNTLSSFIKSSNKLYTVHSDGTVMDSTSTILEPVLINDEPHVHLDWYEGISTCGNYFFKRVCSFGHVED